MLAVLNAIWAVSISQAPGRIYGVIELPQFHSDESQITTQTNFSKFQPHSNGPYGHKLRSVGKQSTKIDKKKMEKYSLVPGLSMNSFFDFNDAKLGGKLVQAVSRFQSHPP